MAAQTPVSRLLGQLSYKPLRRDALWWFAAIYMFGTLLFFVAMLAQYRDHDYYFLDSFFTPVLLVFALCMRRLPSLATPRLRLMSAIAVVLLCGLMFRAHRAVNGFYVSTDDRALQCANNFEGSAQWLDAMGIAADAKVLTLGAYPQNTPFIKMGRRGYACMSLEPLNVEKTMQMRYDYVVIENDILQQGNVVIDSALQQLQLLGSNATLSLYRRGGEAPQLYPHKISIGSVSCA